jgi:lipoprotein-anchoring transpeptidase ErfK/SrfK
VTFEGDTYTLRPKQLGQSADVDGMIDAAIAESREGTIVERVTRYVQGSTVNVNLEAQVAYSQDAVDDFVDDVASKVNKEPVDASIQPATDQLLPQRGEIGISLRENELKRQIREQVESPGAEDEIVASAEKVPPEVTTKELAKEYPTYITVDQSEYKLRLFVNLKLVKEYGVAVGGGGYSTPTGLHSIQDKQVDPTWNVPTSSWAGDLAGQSIPPGPSNPLKARWMGIYDGAGIHGTDDVGSIGSAASHGCIRMTVEDVTDLFDRVEVGTPIYIQ